MRVDLFGLTMDAPGVTFYLWSPWRCAAIEHKLFDALKGVPHATLEPGPDELRVHVTDPKGWKAAVQHLSRVLKGWQEEASDGAKDERRAWIDPNAFWYGPREEHARASWRAAAGRR